MINNVQGLNELWVAAADPSECDAELARSTDLIRRHPSGFLKDREDSEFLQPIGAGLLFRVQTVAQLSFPDSRQIVAQAAFFERSDTGLCREFGSVRVTEDYQGLKLQLLMTRTGICHVAEMERNLTTHSKWLTYAIVRDTNVASCKSLEKAHMVQLDPGHPAWKQTSMTPTALANQDKRAYFLTGGEIALVQDDLAQFALNPIVSAGDDRRYFVRFQGGLAYLGDPEYWASVRKNRDGSG